jgi:hypothetical protein
MAMEECMIGNTLLKFMELQKVRNDTSKYGNYIRIYFYRCRYS